MEYEDRLRISTPEGVDLELTLAGIGSRFTAALIDLTLQILLIVALGFLLVGVGSLTDGGTGSGSGDVGGDSEAIGIAIVTLLTFLIWFGYDVLFEVRGGGRTPGKRLTGLRVVRASGRPVGFVTSAIRNVLRLVDFLPTFYALGVAAVFVSSRNQRLGDMAAGTVVVRDRKGGRTRAVTPLPAGPALDTGGWDVSAVTAEEVAAVRRFLERRPTLADGPRAALAAHLAGRLRGKVAGAPEQAAPEAFLEALSAAKAARADH
ncbi:MAG TPA: RDD family protein [Solirubrobacteraceae bacterium]|jgi:uncharacterized RDD family membrane protein YckC